MDTSGLSAAHKRPVVVTRETFAFPASSVLAHSGSAVQAAAHVGAGADRLKAQGRPALPPIRVREHAAQRQCLGTVAGLCCLVYDYRRTAAAIVHRAPHPCLSIPYFWIV